MTLIFACQILYCQTKKTTGAPITEIFTDFHINLNDTSKTTGFSLNKAYLGYRFLPDNHFSGTIIINVGLPEDLAPGSEPKRYAYFREASISWKKEKLNVAFGITGTRLFDYQQRFWGKRYIANTYQSLNGYGFVADLGVVVDYFFNEILKADITIMNGEGYSNIQLDNGIRTSIGFTLTPIKQLAVRLYGDLLKTQGVWQPMFVGFIGYRTSKITVGGEVTCKSNLFPVKGYNGWGISGTGSLAMTEKTEIFIRFDHSASAVVPGDFRPWNYLNDGNFLIAGFQYTPADNVKFAVDYQGTYPYASIREPSKSIYINALFKF